MARAEVAEALESLDKRCRIMGLSSQYRQAAPRSLSKTPRVQVSPLESLVQTPKQNFARERRDDDDGVPSGPGLSTLLDMYRLMEGVAHVL